MKKPLAFVGRLTLTFILLGGMLSACSPAATPMPAPTQDPATLVAAAVTTLSAKITADALAHPTATPVPATATPLPTNTPIPPTATSSLPTETPTNVATTAPALSAQALYTTTFPDNKREYIPNEHFGLALGFKNTGTVAWDSGLTVKLVSFKGEVTVQKDLTLSKRVGPGEKIEFDLWAFGSETLGQHIWYFQLYNANGVGIPGGAISFSYTSK